MSKKLICTDMDLSIWAKEIPGILSAKDAEEINYNVGSSMKEQQQNGATVAFCSGNYFKKIEEVCKKYGWKPDFISSKCGTVLHRLIDGEYVQDRVFSRKMDTNFDWKVILQEMRYFANGRGHVFIKHPEEKNGSGKSSGWLAMEQFDEHFLNELQKYLQNQGWQVKVSWPTIREQVQIELFTYLGFDPKLVKDLDALHEESGKGGALAFLANLIKPEEILVMGDSGNDYELFEPIKNWTKKQPTCILPSNAAKELRDLADPSRTIFSQYPCGQALIEYLELN